METPRSSFSTNHISSRRSNWFESCHVPCVVNTSCAWLTLISGFKNVSRKFLTNSGCKRAFNSSIKNTLPFSNTSCSSGYNANIFNVPADSAPKGISAISSESIFLWSALILYFSSFDSPSFGTFSTLKSLICSSKDAKYSTTFCCTFLFSVNPFGNLRDKKKFVNGSPKSANSFVKNQSLITLHLLIFSLAPKETINTCFSSATFILSLLFFGNPDKSNSLSEFSR